MLHLSLAQPQAVDTNPADVTAKDRATSLSMCNLPIPSEDTMDVPGFPWISCLHSFDKAKLSCRSWSWSTDSEPIKMHWSGSPTLEARNSLLARNMPNALMLFTLLPAGIEDGNRKASPTRAYERHLSNKDPAWSGTEDNASLQPGMNPSKPSATQTQMTASRFPKYHGHISRHVSTTADTHVQYQPAKRIKHGHQSPACPGIQGLAMRDEHHHPQRDAEDVNLLMINQLKRDLYAKASSRNSLNRSSQNFFVNSAKFSVGQVGPSTSLNHAVEPEQQQVKLKITDIVKFDANVFEQGRTIPEEFKCQAKVDSILSVIESIKSFSRGDEQCQPSESHVEFVKKMINDYSHSPGSASRDSVVGDGAKTAGTPANKAAKKRHNNQKEPNGMAHCMISWIKISPCGLSCGKNGLQVLNGQKSQAI
ncbi:hypothetical protein KEM48_008623 [Puccinia striiformis f. sp. tritici PST-130]|nr:hypothetical protein KEM48_008623 [Puccinia striiformis f. sp. tritici PST-130]